MPTALLLIFTKMKQTIDFYRIICYYKLSN